MGAYEFLPADIDSSGSVDERDFSMFALHWGESSYEYLFWDQFGQYDPSAYTFENSHGSGGSYEVSDGKLKITTGTDNTASVMTTEAVRFAVGDTLCLDVPSVASGKNVFMMCSTTDGQPDGTSTFGFRFRRDGASYARIDLYPGGIQTNTLDPDPSKPATLCVERTSDTDFYYSIIIDGVKTLLGSFTLPQLAGIINLHIGAQAYGISSDTFVFDNLQVYKCDRCGRANLDGEGNIDWNDLRELVAWWLAGK